MQKIKIKKLKIPFIVIIVGAIIIVGGVIFVWKYAKLETLLATKPGYKKAQKIFQENFKDSDNDGLRDWEEELYKTNPNNPDTDNDGYLDGEEVNSGHNPLVKAPNDKIVFNPLPLGEKYNITRKVLNAETLNSILSSYLSQKSDYLSAHPEIKSPETFLTFTKPSTIQEMSRRALAESYEILIEKAKQTLSEIPEIFEIPINDSQINISQNNTQEDINSYFAQISALINSFLAIEKFQLLLKSLENSDFSELDKLIKSDDAQISKLQEIVVPSSLKEFHKNLLGLSLKLRNIFISLRDYQNDPLKAYLALKNLEFTLRQWQSLLEKMPSK